MIVSVRWAQRTAPLVWDDEMRVGFSHHMLHTKPRLLNEYTVRVIRRDELFATIGCVFVDAPITPDEMEAVRNLVPFAPVIHQP